MVTRSQSQQQQKEEQDKLKKPVPKSREDIRKFLKAKRSQLAQKQAPAASPDDVIIVTPDMSKA